MSTDPKAPPYTPADPQEVRPLPTDAKSIRESVARALETLQAGEKAALIAHADLNCGEVFLMAKLGDHWSFAGSLRKPWKGPLQADATVVLAW